MSWQASNWTKAGVGVAVVGVILAVIAYKADQAERAKRQRQQEKPAPNLRLLDSGWGPGLTQRCIIQNESPTHDAIITYLRFRVTDPESLVKIAGVYPRSEKKMLHFTDDFPDTEKIYFGIGRWIREDCFEYCAGREITIAKGSVAKLMLRIKDESLAPEYLEGELELTYNGSESVTLNGIKAKVENEKDQGKLSPKEQEKPIPNLRRLDSGWGPGPAERCIIQNESPTHDAIITYLRFRVTDPESLLEIAGVYPRSEKKMLHFTDDFPETEEIYFRIGRWIREECFEYCAAREITIAKGSMAKLTLRIKDESLAPAYLKGELELRYNGSESVTLDRIMAKVEK